MNLGELVTAFRLYVDDWSGTQFNHEQVRSFLNASLQDLKRHMQRIRPQHFQGVVSFTTVAGFDLEAELPEDFSGIQSVERHDPGFPPRPMTELTFKGRHDGETKDIARQNSWTDGYYVRKRKFAIPVASGAYTVVVYYTRSLVKLVEDDDAPEIPEDFHDLIALGAAKKAFGSMVRKFPTELEEGLRSGMADLTSTMEKMGNALGPRFGAARGGY